MYQASFAISLTGTYLNLVQASRNFEGRRDVIGMIPRDTMSYNYFRWGYSCSMKIHGTGVFAINRLISILGTYPFMHVVLRW